MQIDIASVVEQNRGWWRGRDLGGLWCARRGSSLSDSKSVSTDCHLVEDLRGLGSHRFQHLHKLPLIVILAGILFSLYLQSPIPGEVLYGGDARLKSLLSKQFCAGEFPLDLRVTADRWVYDLWERWLYPFGPPFAYDMSNRYYLAFPFVFPMLSAPFYALLGFRGLYVVPMVSTFALFLGFNMVVFHNPLGAHSFQVREGFWLHRRVARSFMIFEGLSVDLF